MLAAGLPALLLLVASTFAGVFLSLIVAKRCVADGQRTAQVRLKSFSVAVGCTAVLFWVWAAKNCIFSSVHFDLGIITFALAMGALVHSYKAADSLDPGPVRRSMLLIPVAFASVSMNYFLGITLVKGQWTYQLYMCVGVGWWAVAGIGGFILAKQRLDDLWLSGAITFTGRAV
mmetsp:Transcript_81117/g.134004  ORF Transcript_81117/g.134004 Transcript_81117/m.134004 type:complete len:174 (+) Transcript_81117:134-655(+)